MSRSTGRVSRPGEPIIITLFSGAARTHTVRRARRNSFSFPAREIRRYVARIALPRLETPRDAEVRVYRAIVVARFARRGNAASRSLR